MAYRVYKREHFRTSWQEIGKVANIVGQPLNFTAMYLSEGTTFDFRIVAENKNGFSEPLENQVLIEPKKQLNIPGQPIGPIKIRELKNDAVNLTWKAPVDNGGTPITGYEVQFKRRGKSWQPFTTTDNTEVIFDNVKPNEEYLFRIYAKNSVGLSKPLVSEESYIKVKKPEPIKNIKVVEEKPDNGQITLSWSQPSSDDVKSYKIEKKNLNSPYDSWQPIELAYRPDQHDKSKPLEYKVDRLNPNTYYDFRVSAVYPEAISEPRNLPQPILTSDKEPLAPIKRVRFNVDKDQDFVDISWKLPERLDSTGRSVIVEELTHDDNLWKPITHLPDSLRSFTVPRSTLQTKMPRDLKFTVYDKTDDTRSLPFMVRLPTLEDTFSPYTYKYLNDYDTIKSPQLYPRPFDQTYDDSINFVRKFDSIPSSKSDIRYEGSPSWTETDYVYGTYGLPTSPKYYGKPSANEEILRRSQNPLIVTPLTSCSLEASWNDYIPGCEIEKYRIEKWNPDQKRWEYDSEVRGNRKNATIYGLKADAPMWVRVIPYDKNGRALAPLLMDDSVKPQVKLAKPLSVSGVRIEPEEFGVFARWYKPMDDGGSPIKGYKVTVVDLTTGEETNIATVGPYTNQCILPQLNPEHRWAVQITPFNSEGCGPSSRSGPINVPSVELDRPIQPSRIYLSSNTKPPKIQWEMPDTFDYKLEPKPSQTFALEKWTSDTKDWVPITQVCGDLYEYEIPDLDSSVENRFRIYATNNYGYSEPVYTNVIYPHSLRPISRPLMPALLTNLRNNEMDLVWKSPLDTSLIDEYLIERQIPSRSKNWEYLGSVPSHSTSFSIRQPEDPTKYRISSVFDYGTSEPVEVSWDNDYRPYSYPLRYLEPTQPFKLEIYSEPKETMGYKPNVLELPRPSYVPQDIDFYEIQMRQPSQPDWHPIIKVKPHESSYMLENFDDYMAPEALFRLKPISKTYTRDYYAEPAAVVIPHSVRIDTHYRPIIARPSGKGEIDVQWDLPERNIGNNLFKDVVLFERESTSPDWREINRFRLPTNRVTLTERPSDRKYFYGVADVYGDRYGNISSILEPVSSYSTPESIEYPEYPVSLSLRNINRPDDHGVVWDRPIKFSSDRNRYFLDVYTPDNKYWVSAGEIMPGMSGFHLPRYDLCDTDVKFRIMGTDDGKKYYPVSEHLNLPTTYMETDLIPTFNRQPYTPGEYRPIFYDSPYIDSYIPLKHSIKDLSFDDYLVPLVPLPRDNRRITLPPLVDTTTEPYFHGIGYRIPKDYDVIPLMSPTYNSHQYRIPPAPVGPLQIIPIEDSKLELLWQPHSYPSYETKVPVSYIIESRPVDSSDSWTFQSEIGPYTYSSILPRPKFDSYYRVRSKFGDIFSAPLTEVYRPSPFITSHCDYTYDIPRINADFNIKHNTIDLTLPSVIHTDKDLVDYVIQVKSNYSPFWSTIGIIPKHIPKFEYQDIEPDTIYQFQVLPRLKTNILPGLSIPSNYISVPSSILLPTPEYEVKPRPFVNKSSFIPYNTTFVDEWVPESCKWIPIKSDAVNKPKLDSLDYVIPSYYRMRSENIPDRIERYFVKSTSEGWYLFISNHEA